MSGDNKQPAGSRNTSDSIFGDGTKAALDKLKATPGKTIEYWPYWLGFGLIDWVGLEVFKMLPISGDSMGSNMAESLYRGVLTTSRFLYYTGDKY
jgi:hypothetical protein